MINILKNILDKTKFIYSFSPNTIKKDIDFWVFINQSIVIILQYEHSNNKWNYQNYSGNNLEDIDDSTHFIIYHTNDVSFFWKLWDKLNKNILFLYNYLSIKKIDNNIDDYIEGFYKDIFGYKYDPSKILLQNLFDNNVVNPFNNIVDKIYICHKDNSDEKLLSILKQLNILNIFNYKIIEKDNPYSFIFTDAIENNYNKILLLENYISFHPDSINMIKNIDFPYYNLLYLGLYPFKSLEKRNMIDKIISKANNYTLIDEPFALMINKKMFSLFLSCNNLQWIQHLNYINNNTNDCLIYKTDILKKNL